MCWFTARIREDGSGSRSLTGCAPRGIEVRTHPRGLCRAPRSGTTGHHGRHARSGSREAPLLRGSRARDPGGDELGRHGDLQGRRAGARSNRAARLRRRAGADVGRAGRRHRESRSAQRHDRDHDGPHPGGRGEAPLRRPRSQHRAWALARYTPHPIAALEAPVELGSFWSQAWPTTVIRCRRAVNPPETHQRRTAERLKADWHELDTGHYPMLSQPEPLTRLLLASVP